MPLSCKVQALFRDEEETEEVICNGEVLEEVENIPYLWAPA